MSQISKFHPDPSYTGDGGEETVEYGWYPDWIATACANDGLHPFWMAKQLIDSKERCCAVNFPWDEHCSGFGPACGSGNIGSGLCPDIDHCCSQNGWCGLGAEYCGDDGSNSTPIVITKPCGDGVRGNGICKNSAHCCSEYGWCGTSFIHCETDYPTSSPIISEPTATPTATPTKIPASTPTFDATASAAPTCHTFTTPLCAYTPTTAICTSGNGTCTIPDGFADGETHGIAVALPAGARIRSLNVTINMTHPWISDMVINLQAPNGKVLNLFNRHGGRSGANLVNTVVSSGGTSKFSNSSAPFTGTFAATADVNVGPTGYRSNAANFPTLYSTTYSGSNTEWVIAIRDSDVRDTGTLTSWSIAFEYDT